MSSRSAFFRVLGYGEGALSHTFVTAMPSPLPAGWNTSTTHACMLNTPRVISNRLNPLDRIASSSSISIGLLFDGTAGAGAVAGFIRADVEPVRSSDGGYVRTSRYVGKDETTIAVHDSGSITPGYYNIGAECVRVTATTATTLTVVRGERGTWGVAIPYYAGGGGTLVYPSPPGLEDQWCEFGIAEAGAETVLWRGVVDRIEERDGAQVTVRCSSLLQVLRNAQVTTPQAFYVPRWPSYFVANNSEVEGFDSPTGTLGQRIRVSVDEYGDPGVLPDCEWSYARIFNQDDDWVIVPVSYSETRGPYALYDVDLTDSLSVSVLAGGTGSAALTFDRDSGSRRADHVKRVLRAPTRAELARELSTTSVQGVVTAFLEAQPIAGASVGIRPGWTIQTLAMTRLGIAPTNSWDGSRHFMPSYDGKVVDALFDLYLNALFVGLTERRGNVLLVDWAPDIDAPVSSLTTLNGDDAADRGHVFEKRATDALPIVALRQAIIRRGQRSLPIPLPTASGVPVAVSEDTDTSEYTIEVSEFGFRRGTLSNTKWIPVIGMAGFWSSVVRRANQVTSLYGRPLPSLTLQLMGTEDVESVQVGDLAFVARPDFPGPAGVRSSSPTAALCTERSEDVESGSVTMKLLLINWYRDQVDAGVWAPCAVIQSWSAGLNQATVEANAYTSSGVPDGIPATDGEAFKMVLDALGSSVAVKLITTTGAYRDAGTLTAATEAGKMVVTGLSVTPVAGDRFVIADASTVAASVLSTNVTAGGPLAFLADASGDVRGGTQAGRAYSN